LAWDDQAIPLIQSPEMIVTARLAIISGAAHPTEARWLTDGTLAWGGAPAMRQLVADSGRVYGLNDRSIHAIDEATGAPRWTAAADAGTRYLSVSGDQVVVASADVVRSLRAEDGGERWRTGLSSPPVTAVAIGSGRLAVGLEDGSVMLFDAATGAERWRTVMDKAPIAVTPAGDRWLVGVPHLALCALRDSSGAFDWCTSQLRVPSVGRPYVGDKKIYLALLDGTLRTLDRHSGNLARTDRLVGRPATGPLPLGSDLAIPLVSNEFIVVSPDGRLSRVPAPATAGVYSRVGVAPESRSIVTLGVSLSQQMTLSVSRPKD
jgi:outer membrane protein assembly factor BamB